MSGAREFAAACFALAVAVAPGATPLGTFAREMLAAHNAVRARVGVPALAWSNKLATIAQKWADTLIERRRFEHQRNTGYGENLFEENGAEAAPPQVINAWASEEVNYDYRTNICREGMCGHYTQLVWRATREVDCGEAHRGGRQVVVCEYNPPGNYQGERPY